MRIYRRGEVYWCQFKGRRFSLGVTDRKAAEAKFREHQRAESDPNYRPPDETTLGEALKAFVDKQRERGRAEGTISMYDRHVAHLARLLGEHTPLARIEAPEVDGYLSARYAEGAASTSRWKELCTLRGCLKLMRRHKKYPHALDEVMPEEFEGRESTPGERHLLMPDVEKLLAKLPENRAAVVAFIVATAADYPSGCDETTASDVDFAKGLVKVRGSKTAYRDRVVPILPVFEQLLKRAVKSMPFEPWGNVRRDLEVACRRAEVGQVTPRDLRRSHARILRAAGVEPSLIAGMLGHRDGRMVERVYGRLQPDELGALVSRRLETGTPTVQSRTRKARAKRQSSRKQAASA